MEQSPSWEDNRVSASQEIPRILWKPKLNYRSHKYPQPVPNLSHINPVLASNLTSWRSILKLSSHRRLCLPSCLFLSCYPNKNLYAHLLSLIQATCPAHLILLYLITQVVFGVQYKSLNSSLRSFLHSPVTSSLLGPNILLSTLLSNTLSLCSSLNMKDHVSHPYKTIGKIMVLYIWIIIVLDCKLVSAPNDSKLSLTSIFS